MTASVDRVYTNLKNSQDKVNQLTSDEEDEQSINQEINKQLRQHFLNQKKKILFIINPASGAGNAINGKF